MTRKWYTKTEEKLFQAFLLLKTEEEVAAFCRDLMTSGEISEFAARLQVAKELAQGKTQRQVASEQKVGIATVTRVNQWLNRGMNGYRNVLSKIGNIKKDSGTQKILASRNSLHSHHKVAVAAL